MPKSGNQAAVATAGNKKRKPMSDSTKTIILVLLAILILFGTYKLAFDIVKSMTDEKKKENEALQVRYDELTQLKSQEASFISGKQEFDMNTEEIVSKYSSKVTQEKAIIFIVNMSNAAGLTVPHIQFQEESAVEIGGTSSELTDTDAAATDETATDEAAATPETTSTAGAPNGIDVTSNSVAASMKASDSIAHYYLYDMPVNVNYTASYTGLKQMVEYVNTNNQRMTIESLSSTFDPTTGRLTGDMLLNFYTLVCSTDSLTGTTKAIPYVAPYLPEIPVGSQDIFGVSSGIAE